MLLHIVDFGSCVFQQFIVEIRLVLEGNIESILVVKAQGDTAERFAVTVIKVIVAQTGYITWIAK